MNFWPSLLEGLSVVLSSQFLAAAATAPSSLVRLGAPPAFQGLATGEDDLQAPSFRMYGQLEQQQIVTS